jgi:hypothetical protein
VMIVVTWGWLAGWRCHQCPKSSSNLNLKK